MAIQTVNVGTTPNDGTGDPARTAFIKVNDNFTAAENAASRLVATNAQAIAGTAGVLTDAAGVHAAIRGLAVGTVSQSGGVPTGAIIERGSNANGGYTKFADGTMICTNKVTINRVTAPGGKQNNSLIPAATFVGGWSTYKNIEFYNVANAGQPYLYTFGSSLGRFVNSGEPGTLDFSWPPAIGGLTANSEVQTLIAIGRWY